MRPGLSIHLTLESHPDLEPLPGSVSAVDGREVVIHLGAGQAVAPMPRLIPRQAVRIAYRNPRDGAVYCVPAEVKAMDAPRRVALSLLGPPALAEEREGERVEHLLRVAVEVVPPDQVSHMRRAILLGVGLLELEKGEQPPDRAAAAPGIDLPAARGNGPAPRAGGAPPPFAPQLERIERKLDFLIERLGARPRGIESEKPLLNVSLSNRGIRFRDVHDRCAPGDAVQVRIELPLDPPVEALALGEVLHTVDSDSGRRHSAGRDVVIAFSAMPASSRRAITRFTRQHGVPRRRTA